MAHLTLIDLVLEGYRMITYNIFTIHTPAAQMVVVAGNKVFSLDTIWLNTLENTKKGNMVCTLKKLHNANRGDWRLW